MVKPSSDSKPRINEAPSEKLGDSSTVWEDGQVEESNRSPKEGEEEEECGFCLYMKGGGCRESFTAWEVCVEEAKKKKEDFVTNCVEVSTTLYECVNAHSDYYQIILDVEKLLYEEEEVEKEEAEKNQVEQDISEEQEVEASSGLTK